MGMANYQVQAPDGSIHVIQGPDDATPDQVTQQAQGLVPATANTNSPGVLSSMVNDIQAGSAAKDAIQQQADSGKISIPEAAFEKLGATGNQVGSALMEVPKAAYQAVVPDVAQQLISQGTNSFVNAADNSSVGKAYNGYMADNPRVNAMVSAVPGVASILAPAVGADNGIAASLARTADNATMGELASAAAPKVPATAADVAAMKTNSYANMRAANETYPQAQFADPIAAKIDSLMPQPATANGVLGADQQTLANNLTALKSQFEGQDITGEGVDRLGKDINNMMQSPSSVNPTTGDLNETGATIAKVKGAIQDILNSDPSTGSVSGYNGRTAAATEFTLAPIDAKLQAADLTPSNANGYRTKAASLVNDTDFFNRLDPQSQTLLKKAATQTLGNKLTTGAGYQALALGSGLVSGSLISPELGGAITGGMELAKGGVDAMNAASRRQMLEDVRQSVIDNGMGKIKPVPPTPNAPAPLRITGPGSTKAVDSEGNISNTPNPAHEIVNTQPRPNVGQQLATPYPEAPAQKLLPAPGRATLSNDEAEAAAAAAQLRQQPASQDPTMYGGNRPPNRFGHVTPFSTDVPAPSPTQPLQGLSRAGEGLPPNYGVLSDKPTPQSIAEQLKTDVSIGEPKTFYNKDLNQNIMSLSIKKGGSQIGSVSGYETSKGVFIKSTLLDSGARGNGYGLAVYKKLADYAQSKGIPLYSDTNITKGAAALYTKLKNIGYDVEKSTTATETKYGMGQKKGSVFTVHPKGK